MKVFELTLLGWRANNPSDESEDCVKWIKAVDREAVERWLAEIGMTDWVSEMDNGESLHNNMGFAEGVNVIIDEIGTASLAPGENLNWSEISDIASSQKPEEIVIDANDTRMSQVKAIVQAARKRCPYQADFDEMMEGLLHSVLDNAWVDEELESNIRSCWAMEVGVNVINNDTEDD